MECQAGLVYDAALGQCNWADAVDCGPDPVCATESPTMEPTMEPTEVPTAAEEEDDDDRRDDDDDDDDEIQRPGSSGGGKVYPDCPESNQCWNPQYQDCFHETSKECREMDEPGWTWEDPDEKKPDKKPPGTDFIGYDPDQSNSTVFAVEFNSQQFSPIIVGDDGTVRLVPLRLPHHAAVWAHLNANKLPVSSQLLRVSHRMASVKGGVNTDRLRDYAYVDFHRALRYMSERGYAVPIDEEGRPVQARLGGEHLEYARSAFYLGSPSADVAPGPTVGLVNIALFLSQSLSDSVASGSCDELNEEVVDGYLPASNSCGQYGMSYQDMACGEEQQYMECKPYPEMESVAGPNPTGSVDPFYCGSSQRYPFTGEATVTSGRGALDEPLTNANGRTDVENW